ncbi:hypothetical protein COW36_23440 [bacterium (Candidatus Blackallbacteria) CG17_big_fil_post_rev_8_21_14_2_50_48_46]|uniref:Cytochrome c-type biogenesis protein H TPR domain-containing protein n=1 Tax=bacterium (Candidatus Blackallbacteria) CG17_big_fil_post_rev_8_21_14_2_50_48_46 TaxID=2014261 RepID=A0A2M7FXI6_9BACT|nr:MAG: hypothetical protein COW64_17650 [bacterium (Candidatus Blackallbacteria) CG18_big_fil_WC_8_21_14_2_50_49_26]PIW13997.1 MAG: hypothetical protein COW36_23440 [bacterium (Candidatus Blackallbacteria) CG17_big_fil_post_rev_8_21_14_2_50_48_46]PIW46847.1 MAG: hypothetical protein COW20_14615 [bacterium (Candidatus Blackallbacteria) CG13_big_fil_rev_8_21_14_2_50_49_14]
MGTQRRSRPLIKTYFLLTFLITPALFAADSRDLEQKAYQAYTRRNYPEAIRHYQALQKLRPMDAEIWYNLGVVYHYNKQPQQAITAYRQAIELKTDYFDAYNNLGVVYIETKSWDRAIEVYRFIVRQRTEDPDVWFNLGVCYAQSNMPEKAMDAFRKVLALQPGHPGAQQQLKQLEKKYPRLSPANLEKQDSAHSTEALRLYETGNQFKAQKKWKEAIQAYQKSVQYDPRLSEAHYQLGWIFNQTGNHHAALAALVQAVALVPTHVSAHHQMAISYERLGQHGKALEILNNLLMIRSDYAPALYDLGRLYEESNQPEQAIRVFEQLGKQDKSYSDTLYHLGKLHLQQNNPDLAEAYFHESTRLKPNLVTAWIQLGKMAWQTGQTEKAQEYFNQALKYSPQNPELHYTLASMYFQSSGSESQTRSMTYLNQALNINPTYTDALALRGVLHYNAQRYPQAIQDFQNALRQDSQRADLQRNLGLAQVKTGQAQAAIQAFESYLKLEPNATDRVTIQKLVQELKLVLQKKSSR